MAVQSYGLRSNHIINDSWKQLKHPNSNGVKSQLNSGHNPNEWGNGTKSKTN